MSEQQPASIAVGDIRKLVESSLEEVLAERDETESIVVGPTTRLVGRGAVLDSLGLVTLIVEVEDRLFSDHGLSVTLADDRAMSQGSSPFLTVDTLAQYIGILLADAD